MGDMKWSQSKSLDFDCGERFRLKRVVKVPTTPTIYQVFGTAFHTWTEMYDLGYGRTEWPELLDHYVHKATQDSGYPLEQWDSPNPVPGSNQKAYEKFKGEFGLDILNKYVAWRLNTKWQIATDLPADADGNTDGIEYALTYTVGEVEVIAYVDRIFTNGYVVDHKTGSKLRPTIQLPGYMVGLRQKGINATHGLYYEARKGTHTRPHPYTGWDEQRLAAIYEQQAKQQAAGIYIPRPSEDCSSFCSVRRHCAFAI